MMPSPPSDTPFGPGTFTLLEEKDAFRITAIVYELGNDCLVILWGGTRLHIGAVGMAEVRPSLRDPRKTSATSSVFTYLGHKEDAVAKTMSEEITRRVGRNTIVAAGIHWDALSDKDITSITAICRELTNKIVSRLAGSSSQA
jgi:gallate decarboxylase subunit D